MLTDTIKVTIVLLKYNLIGQSMTPFIFDKNNNVTKTNINKLCFIKIDTNVFATDIIRILDALIDNVFVV